jgi:exo-1,4-beta-D-glucosaminidase
VLDFTLAEAFTRDAAVDIAADGVRRAFEIPAISGLTTTYFVRLALRDAAGHLVSRNFYWLSTHDDQLDWPKTQWYTTPTRRHADLTALARLPPTTLSVSPAFAAAGPQATARVTVTNTGRALAFQIRLKLEDPGTGDEILPVFWDDNYFELLPGEQREISVSYPRGDRDMLPRVTAEAWNTVAGK